MSAHLVAVRQAIDARDLPAVVFFRNDDAGIEDQRLYRLLDLFAVHGLPIDLAVIPHALTPALAENLREAASDGRIGLHQHGWQHVNHEPAGRKCEFGQSRTYDQQFADLACGRDRLAELLGDRVDPFFTPPWNRCTQDTADVLDQLGFSTLSRNKGAAPLALGALQDLSVDVDWARYDADEHALATTCARAMASPEPIGIMLHHAVMNEDRFLKLEGLLSLLARHPRVTVAPMRALLAPPIPHPSRPAAPAARPLHESAS